MTGIVLIFYNPTSVMSSVIVFIGEIDARLNGRQKKGEDGFGIDDCFFLACEDLGKMFDQSVPTCAFFSFFLSGD